MRGNFIALTLIVVVLAGGCSPSNPSALQSAGRTSGITGTVQSEVISGVPGGQTLRRPASIEFAIAPLEANRPQYSRATFVKSDSDGKFKVELPAGAYWIGSKAKALDPVNYAPGAVVFSEVQVTVTLGAFSSVDLLETGYAP